MGSSLFTASKSPSSFCLVGGCVGSCTVFGNKLIFCLAVSFIGGLMMTSSSSLVFVVAFVFSDAAEGPDKVEEDENVLSL